MPYKKGTSGNPKGRPKGAAKTADKVKEAFATLVQNNLPQLQQHLDSMPPKDQMTFLLNCAEFILPKLSRTKFVKEQNKASGLRKLVITPVKPAHED